MKPGIRNLKLLTFIAAGCILSSNCIQAYVSPYKSPHTGYLVVEGYILGNGPTVYTLSRSTSLSGDSVVPMVTGAKLQVEGSDSTIFPLAEKGNGVYGTDSIPLSTAEKYRLRISTPDGDTFLSDFVPYKPTPPIDSVNWIQRQDGVSIYVNTHDPASATRYYRWVFDQTWEYNSAAYSAFMYVPASNSVAPRPDSLQIFTCWKDLSLNSIVVGTSAQLASDVIYEYPLILIPANAQQLSIEYSVLVQQYSLTDSAYDFLSMMQRSTESLGSIFDAQPTQVSGNIHSLTRPGEEVIGYISAGTMQQERIYISNRQLNAWDYQFECAQANFNVPNNPDSLRFYFGTNYAIPLGQNLSTGGYTSNESICVDCRLIDGGGVTQKPAFWPF